MLHEDVLELFKGMSIAISDTEQMPAKERQSSSEASHWTARASAAAWVVFHHATKHVGVGMVCSVAYFDPGNWSVDLQAGSQYGYKLLFIVLLSGIFAAILQVLASRLGCVTGLDLASHCRILFYNRPKHTLFFRWFAHYPLYVLSEIAIISTDLAELLGSAIAICLLFPNLPIWAGVLITASDVFLLLALRDPLGGRPVRMFELLIAVLVLAVLICMIIIITKITVNWGDAFDGFVPSKTVFAQGGLYTSVGILGATVMPHSLYLGSHLATQNRLSSAVSSSSHLSSKESLQDDVETSTSIVVPRTQILKAITDYIATLFYITQSERGEDPSSHDDRENNSLEFVRAHVNHATIDIIGSLLGFAVLINAIILVLASAVFYYGTGADGSESPASLFDAYDLVRNLVGKVSACLFALALLAAGQSASIIATVAGQSVSEGFLRWKVSPVIRRLITRLLGLIPSLVVAVAVGESGINTLLVASQVVLSIVLPFVVFPLIWLTSSKRIMKVRKAHRSTQAGTLEISVGATSEMEMSVENLATDLEESADFSNGKIISVLAWGIWLVILIANVYVIVQLGMGQGA